MTRHAERWMHYSGLIGLILSALAIWYRRPTPPLSQHVDQSQAIAQRIAAFAARDRLAWQVKHGDHHREWDDARGHLSLIISDLGCDLIAFNRLLALRYPLTFAIPSAAPYRLGLIVRAVADPRRPRELWFEASSPRTCDAKHVDAPLDATTLMNALAKMPASLPMSGGVLIRSAVDPRLAHFETSAHLAAILDRFDLGVVDGRPEPDPALITCLQQAGAAAQGADFVISQDSSLEQIRTLLLAAIAHAKVQPTLVIAPATLALVDALHELEPLLEADEIAVYSARQWLIRRDAQVSPLISHATQEDPCAQSLPELGRDNAGTGPAGVP